MFEAIEYTFAGLLLGATFENTTRAMLPVRKRSGRDELVLWGRKSGDPGSSLAGPTVPLEVVKAGEWDGFSPRWVKLYVDRFLSLNGTGERCWHNMEPGSFLQGILIEDTDERTTRRVYVVTVDAAEQEVPFSHEGRWPHISAP